MRKFLGVLLSVLATSLGLVLAPSSAGATPVSCGWYQSHTPSIVYQCVVDGNHYIVNRHENVGGNIVVTTDLNFWKPSWVTFSIQNGDFAGSYAVARFCSTIQSVSLAAGSGGWEHQFRKDPWTVEGHLNHFHGWAGNQGFGLEAQPVYSMCTNGTGVTLAWG